MGKSVITRSGRKVCAKGAQNPGCKKIRAEQLTRNALNFLENYWSGRLDLNQRPLHPESRVHPSI